MVPCGRSFVSLLSSSPLSLKCSNFMIPLLQSVGQIIHSFIHSFIPKCLIVHLLYAKHDPRSWGYGGEQGPRYKTSEITKKLPAIQEKIYPKTHKTPIIKCTHKSETIPIDCFKWVLSRCLLTGGHSSPQWLLVLYLKHLLLFAGS